MEFFRNPGGGAAESSVDLSLQISMESDEERTILEAIEMKGSTLQQISSEHGIASTTVHRRKERAIARIRERLRKRGFSGHEPSVYF